MSEEAVGSRAVSQSTSAQGTDAASRDSPAASAALQEMQAEPIPAGALKLWSELDDDDTENADVSDFQEFALLARITTAWENDAIYDRFGIANPDDAALVESIRANGIREPLVVSADFVLLSGHRRLSAARYLGMTRVPIRRTDEYFAYLSSAERLRLLRLYNQQRDKSPGERLRETMLDIDPREAYQELVIRRRVRELKALRDGTSSNLDLGAVKKRARITTTQFLQAAQRVVREQEPYWPLTDRRIHYLLLNDPPLKHDKKPGSRYANDKASYKALTHLLARARLTGAIPMRAIEDATRTVHIGNVFASAQEYIADELGGVLAGYRRDLMQGQRCHVEIVLEKAALRMVIASVASDYCIPRTTIRGFASIPPRANIAARFRRSGKKQLVLLILSDFDPDGEEIAASTARSLRDDFGIGSTRAIKVALTAEQVRQHALPSDMDAKPSSPNYRKFLARHQATKVVELDAAPVELLQENVRTAIESVIDMREFNAQLVEEEKDATFIEARRRVILDAMGVNRHAPPQSDEAG